MLMESRSRSSPCINVRCGTNSNRALPAEGKCAPLPPVKTHKAQKPREVIRAKTQQNRLGSESGTGRYPQRQCGPYSRLKRSRRKNPVK